MIFASVKGNAAVVALISTLGLGVPAVAQKFPPRVIKVLVGFGPGGNTDATARLYGQKMSELLNTSVIVENKPVGARCSQFVLC